MSSITISGIDFTPTPAGPVNVTFKYRLSAALSPWIPLNGGLPFVVPASGVLTAPIVITGLPNDTEYEISAQADCGTAEYLNLITTPTLACPVINDVETVTSN